MVLARECDAPEMAKTNPSLHQRCCALGGAMLPGVEAELAVYTALQSAPALWSSMPVC